MAVCKGVSSWDWCEAQCELPCAAPCRIIPAPLDLPAPPTPYPPSVLRSGEVSGLFGAEEKDKILADLSAWATAQVMASA